MLKQSNSLSSFSFWF